MLLALVLLAVVSLYYDSYKSATEVSPAKLRTDALHYFVESAKKDTGRAMQISARRGAAYLSDYVISNHTTLTSANDSLRQVMVNGTLTIGASTHNIAYMQNQTLNTFMSGLQDIGRDMRFRTNTSLRALDVYMYDSLHFLVVAKYNFSIVDVDTAEGGVCGYENENQTLYVMVPIDGIEDPLYSLETGNKVGRAYNRSAGSGILVLANASLGKGMGGGYVKNYAAYGVAAQNGAIEAYNTSYTALVPYTVFVINLTDAQFDSVYSDDAKIILNNSGGVINYQAEALTEAGFPYVAGISSPINFTNREYVIVRNGNQPEALFLWLADDAVNRRYANSSDGPCFFDRLEGTDSLSAKYESQAAIARSLLGQPDTAPVGIESYVNMSELNSSGLYASITPYENYSSIDYLYFQNTAGIWVYGTPNWFRMDAGNLKASNLTDYCYDDYAGVWHFDEVYEDGGDEYTYEASHNAPDLNMSGPPLGNYADIEVGGKKGNALWLGGNTGEASAYVDVSETACTVGVWIRTDVTCAECGIFSTDKGDITESDRNIFFDYLTDPAHAEMHICANLFNGTAAETICTTDTYNDDDWHFVVHVFENVTGGNQKLYVDGVLKETGSAGFKASGHASQARIRVGVTPDSNENFIGEIDELRIWNRALDGDEILEEYEKLL